MTPARPAQRPRVDALLGWMEGLAEPTRLRVLRALEREELSVLELCDVLAVPQSTASRHLKVLSDAGWLASRRRGTHSLYGWAQGIDPAARRLWLLARAEMDGSERFFTGAAGAWDRLRAEVYGKGVLAEALLALVPTEWTVADLGCGTGALAAELAARVRKVIAVDRSAAMLRAARKRLARARNVEVHEARLEALPVADASCDAAVVSLVLAYLEDPAPALREAARILRQGGRLVVLEAARHGDDGLRRRMGQVHPGFSTEALRALLPPGLDDVRVRALPPEPGAKGPGVAVATARRTARRS